MLNIIVNKTGRNIEIDEATLPPQSVDFIFGYGMRQILNDCHSAVKRVDFESEEAFVAAVHEAVDKKLAALMSGDLTVRRASAEPVNPVERAAVRMVRDIVKTALKAKGLTVKKIGEEKFDGLVKGYLESSKGEAIRQRAAEEVARQAEAMASVNIDLSDLLAE